MFIIKLSTRAVKEEEVLLIKWNPCYYKELCSGRTFQQVHKIGLTKPIRHYYPPGSVVTNPHFPSDHRLFICWRSKAAHTSWKEDLQALREIRGVWEFQPVTVTLETMWQSSQVAMLIKNIPWLVHNDRIIGCFKWIDGPYIWHQPNQAYMQAIKKCLHGT